MQSYQGEHQAFEILHEVIETPQTLRVPRLVHVQEGASLGGSERYMLVADDDLQFLASDAVRLRPERVVFLHDLRVLDNALELFHYALVHICFLANHRVVLVVGVVGIAQLAVRSELEFQKFMPKFAFVTDVIAYIKVRRHFTVDYGSAITISSSEMSNGSNVQVFNTRRSSNGF